MDYKKQTGIKEAIYTLTHPRKCRNRLYTGIPSTDVFDEKTDFAPADTRVLIKEKNKDFVILNFADIHFADYGYRVPYSLGCKAVMAHEIKVNKPDLVILSGDMVCGDRGKNADYYSVRRLTDIMEHYGIPWAPVFGNHDDESNCDLNFLADIMLKSPHCLLQKGDSEMGVGNYVINIAEREKDGSLRVTAALIMMDSHHSQPNEKQQKWFTRCADGINRLTDNKTEISVFMHIPIPEYRYAYEELYEKDKKRWKTGSNGYGELNETICCERDSDGKPVQRGFFDVLKQSGTTKYVFCSHDHMNDYSVEYKGIRLTYMMKAGLASGYQPGFNGATVITLNDSGIKTIEQRTVRRKVGFTVTV